MIKRFPRLCGIVIGLVFTLAAGLFCDDETGSICGKVIKPNGRPAKRALIVIGTRSKGPSGLFANAWISTDKQGSFCLPKMEPGDYIIRAELFGSQFRYYSAEMELNVADTGTLEISIKLKEHEPSCRPAVVSVDEPLMTTLFWGSDLQDIPHGSGGGR